MPINLVSVHGTHLLASDARDVYRQKLARITLDSMVQFVGLLDARGTVLEINKVALDAVGIKLSEVEGRPFWTTFWWQVSPEINATLRECIERASRGEFVRWDTPIFGRSGGKETIIIDASLMPVKDEHGNVVFIAAEGRDITEKKAYEREIARQREELARLDELKTQFFANISHEFRTPLTLMLGPLEDMLADPEELSAKNRERLQLAHRNALRQFKLVNTLLDFSRIEAGRIQASYEPIDLAQMTTDLASVWRSAIERAGMRLLIECHALEDPVYVDRDMWEKIVLNLISNAFKFTFEGAIEVTLRATAEFAVLTVRDTGTGIPVEELPHLFDRFHRVKGARSRSYEGSGIGLALVQELARLHGGTARVESTLGIGSCFTVSIPLGKAHLPKERIEAPRTLMSTTSRAEAYIEEALRWLPDHPAVSETERSGMHSEEWTVTVADAAAGANARVLLVDDNADMRQYVQRLLSHAGFEVETVVDGLAALAAARRQRPHVVLADVMMPGLDGFGLLRAMRADPELREVAIIMLSARAGEESRIEGLRAGADDYLIKPFAARELIARVESHVKLTRFRADATAALRESESRFRALAKASSNVIYRMSPDWAEMQHLQGREFIADTHEPNRAWLEKYIHPDDQAQVTAVIKAAIDSQSVFQLEHRVLRVDGSLGWTLSRAIPVFDIAGRIVEWFGMASDITQRKQLEQSLRDADRRKDEFLATLAHELRNPLAPIRNAVELLKLTDATDTRVRTARDIVDRQVHHMVRLVDDLMEVSRITLGKVTLRKSSVSLQSVLVDALEVAGPAIDAGRHALSVQLPGETLQVHGDATRLSQVFQNLLNNAAKYTPPGGQIELRCERNERSAVVAVRDSGIGIPKEQQHRVFELFTRVHPEHHIKTSGLGIGLALARQLVELHGGLLELRSEGINLGSEFIVTLPLRAGARDLLDARSSAAPPPATNGGAGHRILIVDDNRDAAECLAMLLDLEGRKTRVALNGSDALLLFKDFQPEVVLLDIGLPDVDGYEVARRIRATPGGKQVRLIALTGWGQSDDRRRAQEAGFDQHLTKPVDSTLLSTVIGAKR